jgi:hypothetical protein
MYNGPMVAKNVRLSEGCGAPEPSLSAKLDLRGVRSDRIFVQPVLYAPSMQACEPHPAAAVPDDRRAGDHVMLDESMRASEPHQLREC